MNMNASQTQQPSNADLVTVLDTVNTSEDCRPVAVGWFDGVITFSVVYYSDQFDDSEEPWNRDDRDFIYPFRPADVAACLKGPAADAMRRILGFLEADLTGETLNIYMADKANRTARGVLDNALAELGMEAAS